MAPGYNWFSRRKLAGSHFAMWLNLDEQYFLYTPVSFPVPAFWWNLTIILEQSLQQCDRSKIASQIRLHETWINIYMRVKNKSLQYLIFREAGMPFTCLTPLFEAMGSTLSHIDCRCSQQRWWELQHLIFHKR